MNRKILWISLAALSLPVLARLIWFFPGISLRPSIETPDYQSLTVPAPPLETPEAAEEVTLRGGVVVIDAAHVNSYQPSEIEPLTALLAERGARVEFDDAPGSLETRLKYARAYVVISPNAPFSPDEMRAVQAFVARGGRLIVFTDATRGQIATDYFTGSTTNFPDVNAANPLLAAFDISVNNDYLYNLTENEGNFRNVFFDRFEKHELAFGLQRVAFYGTHSVRSGSGRILFPGSDSTLSSLTDAPVPDAGAAALSRDGNVLVFGDFTFLTVPYNGVADNRVLTVNLADYALDGPRQIRLADFPYIFTSNTVNVLPTSDVQMTAELIGALSRLQFALQPVNAQVRITEQAPADGDLLVLGTYAPAEDLIEFTDPFDLALEEFTEFVESPVFGKVGRAGNGLLLFEAGERGNTLVLLADTGEDLALLLDALSGGTMSGCLIQEDTGVCSIGFGGSFSDEPGFDFEFPPGEFSPGEAYPDFLPSPTPTPFAPPGG